MIKIEVHKNLLFEKPKMVRQPVSLKKSLISFPGQNSESPRVSAASFISRAIRSPSKQTSERLKLKSQRQKQIQNFEEMNENVLMPFDQQKDHNPEKHMRRSNSYKISTSKTLRSMSYSTNKKVERVKTIKSARNSSDQIGLKIVQESKQFYSKKMSQSQISNGKKMIKNGRYDLNNFMMNPNKNDLIICKSLTKNSHLDFFDSKISKLISKKVGEKTSEENDLSDETSFNVILLKIKEKNKSEASETDFETKKLRYMDKLKKSALMLQTPLKKPADQCASPGTESNIFKSTQFSKKGNFKAALQWSGKRLELMKSPFIKSMKSKKAMLDREKAKKQEDQIEGWIK